MLEYPQDYSSEEEMAENSSSNLRYYDPEADEYIEDVRGDYSSAQLGIACAKTFLAGLCTKTRDEITIESEI